MHIPISSVQQCCIARAFSAASEMLLDGHNVFWVNVCVQLSVPRCVVMRALPQSTLNDEKRFFVRAVVVAVSLYLLSNSHLGGKKSF